MKQDRRGNLVFEGSMKQEKAAYCVCRFLDMNRSHGFSDFIADWIHEEEACLEDSL